MLEQCLTTVFATDKGLEAVLRLEMSPDIKITGYEEPPPSPERVDLGTGIPHLP